MGKMKVFGPSLSILNLTNILNPRRDPDTNDFQSNLNLNLKFCRSKITLCRNYLSVNIFAIYIENITPTLGCLHFGNIT